MSLKPTISIPSSHSSEASENTQSLLGATSVVPNTDDLLFIGGHISDISEFDVVINCCAKVDCTSNNNVTHIHFADSGNVLQEEFMRKMEEGATRIEEALTAQQKVIVICFAGISRSVSMVCYWFITRRGLVYEDALELIQSSREIADPNFTFGMYLSSL